MLGYMVLAGFVVSWIVIAVVGLKVGWSRISAIGGGFLVPCFVGAAAIVVFMPDEPAQTAAVQDATAQRGEAASRNTKKPTNFEFTEGTGEWFSEVVLSAIKGDSDRRYLVIKGKLKNSNSSETFVKIVCTAVVTVNFANGKSVDISSEDICGEAGGAALAFMTGDSSAANLTRLQLKPGKAHQIDTSTGGEITAAMVSPLLNEMYASYPVSSAQLEIEITAETAFGDRIRQTVLRTSIPPPSHRARFDLI